ncbi:GntR family transcriptional regulator [Microbacterium sp. ET2]|uniref:GntR family transcriptional regulator n=1 Tax=Microbacterium albipurpureum TaxID=3050384 RepID=UPI00259C796E|nr:GntR family transcriptional regulator [Microbacterium sp. ET2 (Ac-2212)]WJL94946.1 GntR family transcriptional regulator [Microbacterium sp. ET2 (Ac-2212)]
MYDILLEQFMDGTRGAGEPLNIGALTRELDVSQTPLREALARLEHTGLVRREALKGYSVAPQFSAVELEKLMDARLVIEPTLAARAAEHTTGEFLTELRDSIDDLERSSREADTDPNSFRLYWSSDDRFHLLIAHQSNNEFLEGAYRSLSGQVQRYRLFVKAGATHAHSAAEEHSAIYNALETGAPERAAQLMRVHIERARDRALDGATLSDADEPA